MDIINEEILIQIPYGTVSLVDETKQGEECIIFNLFVDEDYRNQGKGKHLVKLALNYIFKHGYKKAFVVVKNSELILFYKKLGFIQTCGKEMYYYFIGNKQ